MENIAVDQKHDLTTRRCGEDDSFDDELFERLFVSNKSLLEPFEDC